MPNHIERGNIIHDLMIKIRYATITDRTKIVMLCGHESEMVRKAAKERIDSFAKELNQIYIVGNTSEKVEKICYDNEVAVQNTDVTEFFNEAEGW